MIFANKQDAIGASPVKEVWAGVVPDDTKFRTLYTGDISIVGGSAINGKSVVETLEWLLARMKQPVKY